MKKIVIFLILFCTLSGCALKNEIDAIVATQNKDLERAGRPVRVAYTKQPGGVGNIDYGVWAGQPGTTVANKQYQDFIFNYFETKCGLKKSDLKEVRVVSHNKPIWYEVWIFSDEKSIRPDKTSGRSVIMRYIPEENATDVFFVE
ncbi:MAG: hypothetical protein AB7D06_02505 [Pedobacter sp.]